MSETISDPSDNVIAFPARPTNAELGAFRPIFTRPLARALGFADWEKGQSPEFAAASIPPRIRCHPGDEVYLYGRGRIGEVRVQVGHHVLVAFPARLHEAPMTVWVARDFLMIRKAAELIAADRRAP